MTAPVAGGGLPKVLRALEYGFRNRCPVCAGFGVGPNGETDRAHTADCPVPGAIRTVEAMAEALDEIADFTADVPDDNPLSHVHVTASAALATYRGTTA